MLKINLTEIQKIYEHAAKEYPRECCGILLGNQDNGQVKEIYWARNIDAIDRQNRHFLINPLELYRAELEIEKKNMEIVGFYHSHADCPPILSKEDQSAMLPGYFYMVVSVLNGVCTEVKNYIKKEFSDNFYEIKLEMDY